MNEVFLDTETTGLSFNEGHKIVEIACIETQDLIPTGNVFHKLINPLRDVPDQAFQVHGAQRTGRKNYKPSPELEGHRERLCNQGADAPLGNRTHQGHDHRFRCRKQQSRIRAVLEISEQILKRLETR